MQLLQLIKHLLISIRSSSSFAERLVAFACVEGIFFSGRYNSISIQSRMDNDKVCVRLFSKGSWLIFLYFSAFVRYFGLRSGDWCQAWHSRMNLFRETRDSIVTLLAFYTGYLHHYWIPTPTLILPLQPLPTSELSPISFLPSKRKKK